MDHNRRKKRKKLKRKKLFVTVLFVIVGVIIALTTTAIVQYQKAFHEVKDFSTIDEEVVFNGVKNKNGNINILLLGIDARGEEKSRTDTIMIAQYNHRDQSFKLASIMRDVLVEIPGFKEQRINTAHALGGPELVRETIQRNFDIDIEYYSLVDFKGFSKIIDTTFPKGIEINVEKEMSKGIGVTLSEGKQLLNGEELLGYVRFRQDHMSDFGRVKRQQEVIQAMKNELTDVTGISKVPTLLGSIKPFLQTNMDTQTLFALAKTFLLHNPNMDNIRIPAEGSYQPTNYSGIGSVLEIDVNENKKILKDFFNEN